PKTKHVHWGSLAIAGACHFVSAPPVFPFLRWTLIRIKNKKPTALVFTRLVKSLLATKTSFVTFSDFASFLLVSFARC
ncbi:hypothetical protein, partial [Shigella sp. FC1967]|uniref:hypothetical protein n=1 Tax=Shigella sp. FC1967 TaxID=1898041 RepID=UPI001C0A7164